MPQGRTPGPVWELNMRDELWKRLHAAAPGVMPDVTLNVHLRGARRELEHALRRAHDAGVPPEAVRDAVGPDPLAEWPA